MTFTHNVATPVLVIAGSDSGGGAGIQADIKAITLLGGYAMTAVTAITVQNSLGVSAVHVVPMEIIQQQIKAVTSDFGAKAIKIGMMANADVIHVVANALEQIRALPQVMFAPLIVDPVMVAKGGAALLDNGAMDAMTSRLFAMAQVVTPNIPELEALSGQSITTTSQALDAAQALAAQYQCHVLAKGGHLDGPEVVDQLVNPSGLVQSWVSERIDTRHSHGTGCTLASAIATGLGQGLSLVDAIERGRRYVLAALKAAPGIGAGNGPMGHMAGLTPFA